jgi:hypothetical protein
MENLKENFHGLCVRERLGTRQNCNDEEKGHFLMFLKLFSLLLLLVIAL